MGVSHPPLPRGLSLLRDEKQNVKVWSFADPHVCSAKLRQEELAGVGSPARPSRTLVCGLWFFLLSCAVSFGRTWSCMRPRALPGSSSSVSVAPRFGVAPSGASVTRPVRLSACQKAFGSTICGTPDTLTTCSGATLKDTMVRAGQSSEQAALIYQHVAAGLDATVRAHRTGRVNQP